MKIGSRTKPKVPPLESGTYIGICIGAVDLGEQEFTYKGKTGYADKLKLIFEIPSKTITIDGKERPRQLSRNFSITTSVRGALRQFVSLWLGRTFSDDDFAAFDTDELLGRPAMLSVVLSEDGQYSNIGSAIGLPDGVSAPAATADYIKFDTECWDEKVFERLPDYIQEQLKKSTQYKNRHLPDQEVSVAAANQEAAEDAGGGEECPF